MTRGCATWTQALAAGEAAARARGDELRRPLSTAQACDEQRRAPHRAIIARPWVPLLRDFDPELFARAFPSGAYCWNCGVGEASFACARCHRAKYCSDACQKAAWWHHKALIGMDGRLDPEFGCKKKKKKKKKGQAR